jgi:hypothetical protein
MLLIAAPAYKTSATGHFGCKNSTQRHFDLAVKAALCCLVQHQIDPDQLTRLASR